MADRSPDRQSNLSRRRSDSGQSPSRPSISLGPEDDLGLEPLGVSDGFAPRSLAGHDRSIAASTTTQVPSDRLSTRRSVFLSASPNPPPQRSSIAKASDQQGGRSSFALQNDAFANQVPPRRTASMATASTVSNETTSTFTIPRTQSPFQGPSRPTHPYAMYPQGTGIPSPSLSLSTTSEVRQLERAYVGVGGPTHPYAMYSQNTVPEGENTSEPAPILSIPVGFPGLGHNYQRRLGPEGEEAGDIIGPDGHTEQLPPYSRYPDGITPKGHASSASGGNGSGSQATSPDTPEYGPSRSQVSLNMPQSRLSIRSTMSDSSLARLNAVGTAESDTSGSLKERLMKKGTRRVCGGKIPLCCIAVVVAAAVLLLGAIAGGLLARHHARERLAALHSRPQSTLFATMTTTLDASPIPTPPSYIPSLPVGTWKVPVDVRDSSDDCLSLPGSSGAWDCGPSGNFRNLQIEVQQDSSGGSGLVQLIMPGRNRPLGYGAQPPVFNEPTEATLALDVDDPAKGPAYFFHLAYDKVVILHETALTPSSGQYRLKRDIGENYKRQIYQDDEPPDLPVSTSSINDLYEGGYPGLSQRDTAQAGDLIWVCVWNNTLLEGFVYITQKTNSSLASSTSSSAAAPSASQAQSTQVATCPYVVKIEERRIPAAPFQPQPYCQMMKVLDNGSLGNWVNSTGGLIIEPLTEYKPEIYSSLHIKERDLGQPRLEGRDASPTCRCEWISQ